MNTKKNKQQPLYKGTAKVTPNKNKYVPIEKCIEVMEKYNDLLQENRRLANQAYMFKQANNDFPFLNFKPFSTSKLISLN